MISSWGGARPTGPIGWLRVWVIRCVKFCVSNNWRLKQKACPCYARHMWPENYTFLLQGTFLHMVVFLFNLLHIVLEEISYRPNCIIPLKFPFPFSLPVFFVFQQIKIIIIIIIIIIDIWPNE